MHPERAATDIKSNLYIVRRRQADNVIKEETSQRELLLKLMPRVDDIDCRIVNFLLRRLPQHGLPLRNVRAVEFAY